MSAHTKGPWHRSGANTVHSDAEGCIVCFVGTSEEQVRRFSGPRQVADANLIAAAPDLLAALRELLDLGQQESIEDGELEAAQKAARAAIARAKGGQP